MTYDVMAKLEMENTAVFVAGGVSKGGCDIAAAQGIFAFLNSSGRWMVTTDLGKVGCAGPSIQDINRGKISMPHSGIVILWSLLIMAK